MVPQLQGNTSPLALLTNVDVRNLSIGSPGSLSEAGTEDDDEQNCLPQSGKLQLPDMQHAHVHTLSIDDAFGVCAPHPVLSNSHSSPFSNSQFSFF